METKENKVMQNFHLFVVSFVGPNFVEYVNFSDEQTCLVLKKLQKEQSLFNCYLTLKLKFG